MRLLTSQVASIALEACPDELRGVRVIAPVRIVTDAGGLVVALACKAETPPEGDSVWLNPRDFPTRLLNRHLAYFDREAGAMAVLTLAPREWASFLNGKRPR